MFQCAFTIRSDTRYLAPLRQWVRAAAAIVGHRCFPRRAVMACSLALIEAVDNAIFHAHKMRRDKPIDVRLKVVRDEITIDVVDRGGGIGNPQIPPPDGFISHGRGLFLIREVMDHVTSRRVGGRHFMKMRYHL